MVAIHSSSHAFNLINDTLKKHYAPKTYSWDVENRNNLIFS